MESIMNNRPRAVFFDWDGTLVDTLPWLLKAHNHVRESLGYDAWSNEEFKEIIRYSSRELYGKLYGEREEEAHAILRAFMEASHLENLKILPDALPLLEYLFEAGIPAGIVSNKRHPFLEREVAHLGWGKFVRIAIGAGYTSQDKPAAEPLLEALRLSGLEPGQDVWYVGDSETDMLTAEAAGCSAVLVRHHHDNEHLIASHAPSHVFDNCDALQDFLRQFASAA